jgi:predicted DNA-binding ribbon-helix-helix protein
MSIKPSNESIKLARASLYNEDYLVWIETQIDRLNSGNLSDLDISNLIEELEDMGNSQKLALGSNLRVLLMHLLKYQYQPQKPSNSWLYTIREHRLRILKALKTSPSLKNYFHNILAETYTDSRYLAADETGLNINSYPIDCSWNIDLILNLDWFPE